ncbi:hypothetical protein RF11_14508 [Thelohanellus kitauei]|uniref:Uncharacterized protein n=1 Tax=Thelohanellus kitauei TaxID=669202 RepID=A0A0C2JAY6_THEKT|nr:hypothetical protein RF11_14508 [Thelohanellus kitauei]
MATASTNYVTDRFGSLVYERWSNDPFRVILTDLVPQCRYQQSSKAFIKTGVCVMIEILYWSPAVVSENMPGQKHIVLNLSRVLSYETCPDMIGSRKCFMNAFLYLLGTIARKRAIH